MDPCMYQPERNEQWVSSDALHSRNSVGVATLFGSKFAAAIVIGISLMRQGRHRLAWAIIGASIAAFAGFIIWSL